MAGFTVTRAFAADPSDVRASADHLAKKLKDKHNVKVSWDDNTMNIKGTGVKGSLEIKGQQITISVKLGIMLAMFEKSLREEVETYLDRYIK